MIGAHIYTRTNGEIHPPVVGRYIADKKTIAMGVL
jgi:hypothetical protein